MTSHVTPGAFIPVEVGCLECGEGHRVGPSFATAEEADRWLRDTYPPLRRRSRPFQVLDQYGGAPRDAAGFSESVDAFIVAVGAPRKDTP